MMTTQNNLFPAAEAFLRACSAKNIMPGTLAKRFGLGLMQAEALEEQLQMAGLLGEALPPFNQRKNRVAKPKEKTS